MRRFILLAFITGCAGATPGVRNEQIVVHETPDTPPVVDVPVADTRVAEPDFVLQTVEAEPITDLLAAPSWPHAITTAGGVVAIHDTSTGEVRASMRPWPRANVRVSTDASGTYVLLEPLSSNVEGPLLWSLEDDRLELVGHRDGSRENPQGHISPRGDRLVFMRRTSDTNRLWIEDARTHETIASRDFADFPRADFTRAGDMLLVAESPQGAAQRVSLLDATTLVQKFSLGEASAVSPPLRNADRVLLATNEGLVMRSTTTGAVVGTVSRSTGANENIAPRSAYESVQVSAPREALDGKCIALPVTETSRVRLYRTDDLAFIHEATLGHQGGTYDVLPDCRGLIAQSSLGEVREIGPSFPVIGSPFGSLGDAPNRYGSGPRVTPIVLVAQDTVILANALILARLVRGAASPTFLRDPQEIPREHAPWAFGFLRPGSVYVVRRGFVDVISESGFLPTTCEGPGSVLRAANGRVILATRGQICDLEYGRVHELEADVATATERYVVAKDRSDHFVVFDLEQATFAPLAPAPATHPRPVAISRDGTRVAFSNATGTEVVIRDGARLARRAPRITLAHVGIRFVLHDAMLEVRSAQAITLYDTQGAVRFDRAIEREQLVSSVPSRPYFIVANGATSDVVDSASGRVLSTIEGTPFDHEPPTIGFEVPLPITIPVLVHDGRSSLVHVANGEAHTLDLGAGRMLGASMSMRFVAMCDAGTMRIFGATNEPVRELGSCLPSDRVTVRDDGQAIVHTRGVRVSVRTSGADVTLTVARNRSGADWFATARDGRFYALARTLDAMLYREAGPLLRARLVPPDPARASLDVLSVLRATPH